MTSRWLTLLLVLGAAGTAAAESATVAVAANFIAPLEALKETFEASTDHELVIVSGSTAQLYTQIVNGAPFDVLLAADQERPERLAAAGLGDPSTRITYAIGALVLWTRDARYLERLDLDVLRNGDFRWLAIANPDLAPYGVAARQTLNALGLWHALERRIVQGQNIGQAFAMAETGNAELAMAALSQAVNYPKRAAYIAIPSELHDPIRQDAILLARARSNAAARAFLSYIRTPTAQRAIERFGYVAAQ